MGEKISIVGYRDVSFTDDSGREVSGRSYYYTAVSEGVEGLIAGKLFISRKVLQELQYRPMPGDDVIVYYNRFGKPGQFEPA